MENNIDLVERVARIAGGNIGAATALTQLWLVSRIHGSEQTMPVILDVLEDSEIEPPYIWAMYKDLSDGKPKYFRAILWAVIVDVIPIDTLLQSAKQRKWIEPQMLDFILDRLRRDHPHFIIEEKPV